MGHVARKGLPFFIDQSNVSWDDCQPQTNRAHKVYHQLLCFKLFGTLFDYFTQQRRKTFYHRWHIVQSSSPGQGAQPMPKAAIRVAVILKKQLFSSGFEHIKVKWNGKKWPTCHVTGTTNMTTWNSKPTYKKCKTPLIITNMIVNQAKK